MPRLDIGESGKLFALHVAAHRNLRGETMSAGTPLELTRAEIVAQIDAEARRRLDMSAEDLVRAYRRGELTDPGRVADLLALGSLLDLTDPLFVLVRQANSPPSA